MNFTSKRSWGNLPLLSLLLFAIALFANAAFANPIAFVRAAQSTNSGGTSVSVSLANTASDALVVACRQGADLTSISSVSDSAGNTYSLVRTASDSGGGTRETAVYLAVNIKSSASNTVSCNFASNLSTTEGIVVEEFSNVAGLDTSVVATSNGSAVTSLSSGTLATTQSGDALVFAINASTSVTWTAGSGYTIPSGGSNSRQAAQYVIVGAAGNYSTSISWNTSAEGDAIYLALAPTTGGSSSIAFVGASQHTNSGGTSVTTSMANTAGDALVVACRQGADLTSISSVSDSAGNTYSLVNTASDSGGGTRETAVYLATNIKSSASNTVSCNFASNLSTTEGIVVEEFSNVAGLDANVVATSNGSTVTSLSSGTLTTTHSGDALVFAINASASETWTAGSGYTIPSNGSNAQQAAQYLIAGAAGGYSTSISWNTSARGDAIYLALYPVSGGGGPPPTPTGLSAIDGNAQVSLTWNTSTGATSYNVKRSTTSGGPYTTIASPTTNSYTDTGLTNGTTYYYVVSAVNSGGESSNSSQVSATPTLPPPPTPTGLSANAGNAQVSLTWNTSTGATSYNVKRSTTTGGPYTTIASPTTASYTDTGVTNGTTYYYVVSAVNSGGESNNSTQVSATPVAAPPATPTDLTAEADNAQAILSWDASFGATSYNVKRSTTSGGPYTTVGSPTTNTYTNSGLTNGTTYYYVVSAVNSGGESANSSELDVTPNTVADFTTSISPASQTVTQGGNATYTVTVTAINGFTGKVLLDVNNLPAGARASFNPMTVSGSGTSTLTIATDNSTAVGTFTPQISGNCADLVRRDSVALTVQSSGATPPPAPTNLSATGAGANAIALSWAASNGATGYNIDRSTTQGGPYTTIASTTIATVYNDTTVSDGTAYYYVVTATGAGGESGYSNEANARPHLSAVYQVNSGGNAVGTWSGDSYVATGSSSAAGNLVDTSHVVAPAPMAVYQTNRWFGASPWFSYVFPNLTPNASYTVRLHFADNWHGGTGDARKVSASINGTSVLSNFDIAGSAGGQYIAIIKEFSASADGTGNITVAISSGGAGNPMISGLEVLSASPVIPAAPINLTAASGRSANTVSWNPVMGASSYNVKRSTNSGGPYSNIATNVTSTVYTDSTAANSTTYYYVVSAVNTAGEGALSSQASATASSTASFGVTATQTSTSDVAPGHNVTYAVTVTPTGGFSGTVNLSAGSLPTGVTASFNPASVSVSNATPATTTLTLTTTTSLPSGNDTFTITGTSGAIQSSMTAGFHVGWTLAWSDEFNGAAGTQPSTSNWTYATGGGGWGNAELECYTNSTNNIVEDGNGNLVITATYTPTGFTCPGSSGNYYYNSARIYTTYITPPYGRYEARIKLPPGGKGVFPAFWMLGNGTNCTAPLGSWPSCGEIDILELFSQNPNVAHTTIHRTNANGSSGDQANSCASAVYGGSVFGDDYHTFTLEWAQGSLTFLMDDNKCGVITPSTNPAGAWPFDNHPFQILLNFAVGGTPVTAPDATTVWPQRMYTDYVRVFNAAQ